MLMLTVVMNATLPFLLIYSERVIHSLVSEYSLNTESLPARKLGGFLNY